MSKDEGGRNSSFSEKPVRPRPRRLADWINLTGAKKVHSLIDKVYKRKNLEMAWEKVKENRGSGGVDGQSLEAFGAQLKQQLKKEPVLNVDQTGWRTNGDKRYLWAFVASLRGLHGSGHPRQRGIGRPTGGCVPGNPVQRSIQRLFEIPQRQSPVLLGAS